MIVEMDVVDVIDNEHYTHDGNIRCSSGISAGMDMTLEFINHIAGNDIAGKVQLQTEYCPSGKIYGKNIMILPAYVRTKK
jgi:transcriptional regulator GlxA family with amidase domain